jgi:putative membrane protein
VVAAALVAVVLAVAAAALAAAVLRGDGEMLTKADQERIAAAIAGAESKTAGEIFCVLTRQVSRYREVPLLWAALAAFVLPPILVLIFLERLALASIFSSWTEDSARAMQELILRGLTTYAILQLGVFLIVAIIVALPGVRSALTPPALKRYRVRQAARRHFASAGARLSKDEPHVLIFASFRDRKVELVAHSNIHQIVGEGPWNAAIAAVTDAMSAGKPADGFVKAIEICGAALAQHFPPTGAPKNRLPNTILET